MTTRVFYLRMLNYIQLIVLAIIMFPLGAVASLYARIFDALLHHMERERASITAEWRRRSHDQERK